MATHTHPASSAIAVRPARRDEFAAIGEICAGAYVSDGLLHESTDRAYLSVLRDVAHRAESAEVLAAVDEHDVVLGAVTFVDGPGPYADLARPDEAEFRTLAVSPAGRGLGVGRALVLACIDRARALDGCVRVVISTQPTMAAARHIYEGVGFVRLPDRDWKPVPHITLLTYGLTL